MKRIVALLLLVACVFSLASCAVLPIYNSTDVIYILKNAGYTITYVDESVQEGIIAYIYGNNSETGDEIYYIYCENLKSANSIYEYISSKQKAKIAEIKMKIDTVEYALYKSEGISAAEKGDYYRQYVELTEALEEIENYTCGRGFNLVWYGTKKAVSDIKKG